MQDIGPTLGERALEGEHTSSVFKGAYPRPVAEMRLSNFSKR
jgi:hypothetical protein